MPFYAIPKGGLIALGLVSERLCLPKKSLRIAPGPPGVVVDDVVDTGRTLRSCRTELVVTVCLCRYENAPPVDFYGEVIPDDQHVKFPWHVGRKSLIDPPVEYDPAKRTVLVDVDGTLMSPQGVIRDVLDEVLRLSGDMNVVVVTARLEDDRALTERHLHAMGVPYSRLLMRDQGTPVEWKRLTVEKLAHEGYDLHCAFEDDREVADAIEEFTSVVRV